jgi:hypothetical protein
VVEEGLGLTWRSKRLTHVLRRKEKPLVRVVHAPQVEWRWACEAHTQSLLSAYEGSVG